MVSMSRVFLKSIRVQNFGPIKDDTISFNSLTFLVGRNNAGKSHYLKAVELLLTSHSVPNKYELLASHRT